MAEDYACPMCDGTGQGRQCRYCNGTGDGSLLGRDGIIRSAKLEISRLKGEVAKWRERHFNDVGKAKKSGWDDAESFYKSEMTRKDKALDWIMLKDKTYRESAVSVRGALIRCGEIAKEALSPAPSWLDEHDKRVLFEHADRNNCESARSEAVAIDDLPDREER